MLLGTLYTLILNGRHEPTGESAFSSYIYSYVHTHISIYLRRGRNMSRKFTTLSRKCGNKRKKESQRSALNIRKNVVSIQSIMYCYAFPAGPRMCVMLFFAGWHVAVNAMPAKPTAVCFVEREDEGIEYSLWFREGLWWWYWVSEDREREAAGGILLPMTKTMKRTYSTFFLSLFLSSQREIGQIGITSWS